MFAKEEMRQAICGQLEELGWTSESSTALASRVYQTAVGDKVAFAYLADYGQGSDSFLLQGEYWSTGSNCLGPCSVAIPKSAELDKVKQLAMRFASKADEAINESYARRLHLRYG